MKFSIDNIPIYFPHDSIYPEQYKYIKSIVRSLYEKNTCVIQMPSGAGKTISLLSATLSYTIYIKENFNKELKIIFCSRTVPEIQKSLVELDNLYKYILNYKKDLEYLGIGLASRKHLCINDEVKLTAESVDIGCSNLKSQWSNKKCIYFENLKNIKIISGSKEIIGDDFDIEDIIKEITIPSGIYTLDTIIPLAQSNGVCPYYLSRKLIEKSNITIYTYNYMLDPSIYDIVSKEISKNAVIIFDEAHNIDNSIISSYTYEISISMLRNIENGLNKVNQRLEQRINESEELFKTIEKKGNFFGKHEHIPHNLYDLLVKSKSSTDGQDEFIQESSKLMPGNLKKSSHFLSMLYRLLGFFKKKMKTSHMTSESLKSFSKAIFSTVLISKRAMAFTSSRFVNLIDELHISIDREIQSLKYFTDFISVLSNFNEGFVMIFDPFDVKYFEPTIYLDCLDCSIGFQHILNYRNVIITSGTLTPLEMYPKLLGFTSTVTSDIETVLVRNAIKPVIVTKGNDQTVISMSNEFNDSINEKDVKNKLTTSFSIRSNPSVIRNYGLLLIELSKFVPDGIVVFFPSYLYLEEVITAWQEMKVIDKISENKLIFLETPNYAETEAALNNYKKSIDVGTGSILFCVARGKVSEGVDFKDGYGRCVVILGVPFQYTESVHLRKRLEYLNDLHGINELEFLTFDAMRHAAQCLGRVLRSKTDYGLMVLADQRFSMSSKKEKLPGWIKNLIFNDNVSIETTVNICKKFFIEMGQPIDEGADNYSRLNHEQLVKKIERNDL